MGELIVSVQMTLDAVIDQVDAWFAGDDLVTRRAYEQLCAADALLLGRDTYVGLAQVWPTMSDEHGLAELINRLPKYVVSRTLNEPLEWNAQLVGSALTDEVRTLRREKNLIMYGCGPLAAQLVEARLVDELRVGVHPIVHGTGTRLFGGAGPVRLDLLGVESQANGVVEYRYRPAA